MSLQIVKAAAQLEKQDDFHLARLLLLLSAYDKMSKNAVEGITKLAKLDFLLRYPTCLDRVLKSQTKVNSIKLAAKAQPIDEKEVRTIESKMIRFRYGPWDDRYRRWIGLLMAKGLVIAFLDNKTVNLQVTAAGQAIAEQLTAQREFQQLATRSELVVKLVGKMAATVLKNYIYEIVPEITAMKWGDEISL